MNARREFEWNLNVAEGVAAGYGRVEVNILIDPSDYNSRADKFRQEALLGAAAFLDEVSEELVHMLNGEQSNDQ